MNKISLFIGALACFFLLSCDYNGSRNGVDVPYSSGKASLSREKLISAVKKEDVDLTVQLLNEIKTSSDAQNYYSVLGDFWNLDVSLYSGVSEQFLLNKSVRIEIADALVQGVINNKNKGDLRQFLDYSRSISKEDGCVVFSKAILIIGRAGASQDLDLIENTLLMEDECSYRAAVLGLVQRCDINVDRVSGLGRMIRSREVEMFLMETWRSFEDFRSLVCRRK